MAEQKTHKVRITGIPIRPNSPPMNGPAGWIYEKAYPNAKTFTARVPVGATVEVDDATMVGWKRKNAVQFEVLDASETVDVSIVEHLAEYEKELIAQGKTVIGHPTRPTVNGKIIEGVFKDSPPLGSDTPKEKTGGVK